MQSYERRVDGRSKSADAHEAKAVTIVNAIKMPEKGMHYMQRQYHKTNFQEFLELKRLSAANEGIRFRLEELCKQAYEIPDDAVFIPKDSFDIQTYVGTGMQAASIAGLVLASYGFSNIDLADVQAAIGELWESVASVVYSGEKNLAAEMRSLVDVAAANTGGLADVAANTGGWRIGFL